MTAAHTLRTAALACAASLLLACTAAATLNGRAPLATDNGGRYTTPVTLDGRPLRFIVDTGAQSSVLFANAAERLGLKATGHAQVKGTGGSQQAGYITVSDYRSGVFARRDQLMVIVPSGAGSNADGVMGMDAFATSRLEFDRADRRLSVGPSRPPPSGFAAQRGAVRQGSFLVVDAIVDGVHVDCILDSGAHRTAANPKLQAALGIAAGDARLHDAKPSGGATTQSTTAHAATLGRIDIGGVSFTRPTMTFADLPVFRSLDADDGPAMILGMDQLSRLQAFAIDYPRQELQLRR